MKGLLWVVVLLIVVKTYPPSVFFLALYLFFWVAKAIFKPQKRDGEQDQTSKASMKPINIGLSFGELADLLVFRRELARLKENEKIDRKTFRQLNLEVDQLEERFFRDHGVFPDNDLWNERKEAAWDLLNVYADTPLGPAPWRMAGDKDGDRSGADGKDDQVLAIVYTVQAAREAPDSPELGVQPDAPAQVSGPMAAATVRFSEPKIEFTPAAIAPPTPVAQNHQTVALPDPLQAVATAPLLQVADLPDQPELPAAALAGSPSAVYSRPDIENYAWQRHEPGPLEKAFATLSGWHALAAPFLLQNIGWFIGVFLFIAGSIFLVSYSTGYLKSLLVFLAFFLFTLFLLWGGYQLRRKRPDLTVSSDVVLILSLLMIPLTTATVTRLLISSETLLLKSVSVVLAAVEFGAFYVAAMLVSALMDRSLQGRLPKIFLALTFAQLLLTVLNAFPYWPLLALGQGVLLALLGIGIHRFVKDWLHSIFVDQRKIAYFSAGLLVYAALVTFVHLTYGSTRAIELPAGYYGPFLMIMCGLLFYVDAQFKQWTQANPTLSRFSFLIYGVSILALYWVAGQHAATVITLLLAMALYATVIWNYLTLTPLYLFLGCCFWLYQLTVLRLVPDAAYFLAALPGLAGLYGLAYWAGAQRRPAYLALIIYRVLYMLASGLTLWSLARSEPGTLAMTSAAASGMLFYVVLKSAPEHLFTRRDQLPETFDSARYRNLLDSPWFYLLPGLAAAAVYYAPPLSGLTSTTQFAFAVLPIVMVWGSQGLFLYAHQRAIGPVDSLERHFNAALLTFLAAALPVFSMNRPEQAFWFALAGVILLWFSLKLEVRGLFYLMLGCFGGAAVICKLTYFPWPTLGLTHMGLALGIWGLLKYLQFLDQLPSAAVKRRQAAIRASLRPSFKLLWRLPVNAKTGGEQDV